MPNTIAAISTAQGAGGIGIIRISGDDAYKIADAVFKSPSDKKIENAHGYSALYGRVFDGADMIDEAIALVFKKPNSYTGENVVELSCHGGLYITQRVLRAVLNAGAKPAEPGEFTKRAFMNGKLQLTQAEAVMDIINAQGNQAARIALMARDGALTKRIAIAKDKLINSAAHLSAWADYPDEEIPEVDCNELQENLSSVLLDLKKLLNSYDAGKAIREGIETVIVGKPNVGKSTLMNLLTGYEKSIVTDIPGTTRDIVEETIRLGDVVLHLADTAGIHSTEDEVEKIGVIRAVDRLKSASLVLAMFDGSEALTDEDKNIIDQLVDTPCVIIVNKTDLEMKIGMDYIKQKCQNIVEISAKNAFKIQDLENMIADVIGTSKIDGSDGILATERQRNAVVRAIDAINESIDCIKMGITLDAITVCIEDAIQALLELSGERATEAVVDGVFAHFCVGK